MSNMKWYSEETIRKAMEFMWFQRERYKSPDYGGLEKLFPANWGDMDYEEHEQWFEDYFINNLPTPSLPEDLKEWIEGEAEKSYPIKQGRPDHFTDVVWANYLDRRTEFIYIASLLLPEVQRLKEERHDLLEDKKAFIQEQIDISQLNQTIEEQKEEIERLNDIIRNRDECIWQLEKQCGDYATELLALKNQGEHPF